MGSRVIDIGAIGWNRGGAYYPEDLPADWRLAYYANEHDSVWVPGEAWLADEWPDTAAWREDVGEAFRFVAVLDDRHLHLAEPAAIGRSLAMLGEQLVAVVGPVAVIDAVLADVEPVVGGKGMAAEQVWTSSCTGHSNPGESGPALGRVAASELDSPKAMRAVLEGFADARAGARLFLGVDGPMGIIDDLRTLARLMGL